MVGEAEFSLYYGLPFFAHVDTFTELIWVLIKEKERKSCYKLLLASRENLDLVLLFLVVIV